MRDCAPARRGKDSTRRLRVRSTIRVRARRGRVSITSLRTCLYGVLVLVPNNVTVYSSGPAGARRLSGSAPAQSGPERCHAVSEAAHECVGLAQRSNRPSLRGEERRGGARARREGSGLPALHIGVARMHCCLGCGCNSGPTNGMDGVVGLNRDGASRRPWLRRQASRRDAARRGRFLLLFLLLDSRSLLLRGWPTAGFQRWGRCWRLMSSQAQRRGSVWK